MNFNDEEFFQWILVLAFWEKKQQEWNQLRDKDYSNYFRKLFRLGIPTYTLESGKSLYRARQIKISDNNKLGVDVHDIADSYFKIVLSDEDIAKLEESNRNSELSFTLQHLFMLKAKNMESFTEEQQQRIDELNRVNSIPKVYGFSEKDSRVPPPDLRKLGRLSNASDAYLYLAFDKDTAIYEMRPSIGQQYSLAQFCTNKELSLADLTGKKIDPAKGNTSLLFVANKISEPNTDNKDDFYYITQYMAHMLQERGFDGIMYQSALKLGKDNILIFDEDNVDFMASEIVTINNVSVDYSNILPLENTDEDSNTLL